LDVPGVERDTGRISPAVLPLIGLKSYIFTFIVPINFGSYAVAGPFPWRRALNPRLEMFLRRGGTDMPQESVKA
jgi:hypothetical protein